MADHLTVCLATDEATVKAFLTQNGHVYQRTYGPLNENDVILNSWVAPSVNPQCGVTMPGAKVLIHTVAP